jgi:cytochrome c553
MCFRITTLTTLTLITAISSFESIAAPSDINTLKAEAISIVKQFGGTLKPQLKKALSEGGVSQAMKVCSVKAPQIAQNLSEQTQWQVKRVSLKARNNKTAKPDLWETSVLKAFDQRQAQGESAKTMAKAEVIDNEFRFMKAQGVAPLCLTCHGTELTSETKSALKHYYPNDNATGYTLGQIRGAFSLTKTL